MPPLKDNVSGGIFITDDDKSKSCKNSHLPPLILKNELITDILNLISDEIKDAFKVIYYI
jgi:hypothetical protein